MNLTANQNAWNLSAGYFIYVTSTGNYNINGIANGVDGKMITIYCATAGNTYTFAHLSGSASATNQILCPTGADVVITGPGCVKLIWTAVSLNWLMLSKEP
jgi:hypothetical protein